ncbi:hypothetical protein [Flectobacillus roseus]|uniref:Uncharacterized protein n=1 Tax=Flectobacillus roseus TaxID=502259 RepID=A0ABT6Y737_9BACT|nr:hypothetical protein [Flectobacillus roseus]MDI9859379.1 hypothetical protein [Flectobacillus roseus]
MNLRKKYLDKLRNEQILANFYTDNYDESDYGFVVDYNDDFLLIEKFDDECNYDGFTIFFLSNISRIRWSGNDIDSISKLIDYSKRQLDKINIDLTSIQTILEGISKTFNHLTVHVQDLDKGICFIGKIHEMDDHFVVIHEFGTMSSLDRKFILLGMEDITRIDACGQYENNLIRLFNL